jgi:adenylate cyclase
MKDKPVILVVDDRPQNIELLEEHLAPQGYEIVKAANGEEALEQFSSHQIDLILLDVMMPGMNGYEVCRKVKRDSNNTFLPIVMLTALGNMDAKIEGFEAGADDFLNKPFHEIELIARVKNLLKIKFLHDEVELKNHLVSSMLHRYVNSFVIEQILANPEKYSELGGDRKEVAAFFCDIRGFTSLSENTKADELIHLLNSIYKELHHGFLGRPDGYRR